MEKIDVIETKCILHHYMFLDVYPIYKFIKDKCIQSNYMFKHTRTHGKIPHIHTDIQCPFIIPHNIGKQSSLYTNSGNRLQGRVGIWVIGQ